MRHLILLFSVALTACATTGLGGGNVAIETSSGGQPLPGAVCAVSTYGGSWKVTTPATLNVGGTNGDLRVVCNKEGYRTSEMIFRPSGPHSGSSVGLGVGGGSGGRVGVGLGLSLPILLGGGGYPSQVNVEMNRQ
jgi:hypothetical protein